MTDRRRALWARARFYSRVILELVMRLARVSAPIRVSYIICSTPRSGSGLLSDGLWRTVITGRPAEYFSYWTAACDQSRPKTAASRRWSVPAEAFVSRMRRLATAHSSGVAGIKTMWDHFDTAIGLLKAIPEYRDLDAASILGRIFANPHYVYITRRDKVAQAVSWSRASQSGEWFAVDAWSWSARQRPPRRAVAYDFQQISHYLERVLEQEAAWEAFFERSQIRPYRVVYEELVDSWEFTTRDLLRHLDVPHYQDLFLVGFRRKGQRDSLNTEWARRFVEDRARAIEFAARPAPYMICATPRSGSGLLAHWLWSTGVAGNPGEYFLYWRIAAHDPARLREEANQPWVLERPDYMAKLRKEATTGNGVLAIKVMEDHIDVAITNLVALYPQYRGLPPHEVFEGVFPGIKYVYITRRDKVRQAVSWAKASQRNRWFHLGAQTDGAPPELVYDFNLIDHYYHELLRQERRWEAFFSAAKVSPFRVVYEEFLTHSEPIARDLLQWAGVWQPWPLVFYPSPDHASQWDSLNEEWVQRYRQASGLSPSSSCPTGGDPTVPAE